MGKDIIIRDGMISEINITLTEPKAGAKPNTAISTDTEGVAVSSSRVATTADTCKWYHGTEEMTDSDTFAEGETYTARFMVRAISGYELADSLTVYANSRTATYRTYEISYTIPVKTPIDEIYITAAAPKAGAKPDGTASTTNTNIAINSPVKVNGNTVTLDDHITWYTSDNSSMLDEATDTFEAGNTYNAYVQFQALEGYKVTADTKVYLNGVQMNPSILTALFGYDGVVTYVLPITVNDRTPGDVNGDGNIGNTAQRPPIGFVRILLASFPSYRPNLP